MFLKIITIQTAFETGRWIILCYIGLKMTSNLHDKLLYKVMNAPVNLFFDVMPFSKVYGHFLSDV
jgi:L-cystine uptake protein TcyP (sodium:dicarboxylate symporter family)